MKKVVLFNLLLSLFIIPVVASSDRTVTDVQETEQFVYPINATSSQWDFLSIKEKVDMLRIPDETLECMSNKELIEAIAEYPFLIDIYVYGNTINEGIQVTRKYFSALDELLSRDGSYVALIEYALPIAEQCLAKAGSEHSNEASHNRFVAAALMDIIKTLDEDINELNTIYDSRLFGDYTTTRILTPNGSEVVARIYTETHDDTFHADKDQEICEQYGVELLAPGTCLYNCHSYAWYLRETTNPYWIEQTTAYRTDGSYIHMATPSLGTMTNAYSIAYGDIIYYGNNSHSAVFCGNPMSGAPVATQYAISKWGKLGLFRHTIANVPYEYDTSSLQVWHKS